METSSSNNNKLVINVKNDGVDWSEGFHASLFRLETTTEVEIKILLDNDSESHSSLNTLVDFVGSFLPTNTVKLVFTSESGYQFFPVAALNEILKRTQSCPQLSHLSFDEMFFTGTIEHYNCLATTFLVGQHVIRKLIVKGFNVDAPGSLDYFLGALSKIHLETLLIGTFILHNRGFIRPREFYTTKSIQRLISSSTIKEPIIGALGWFDEYFVTMMDYLETKRS